MILKKSDSARVDDALVAEDAAAPLTYSSALRQTGGGVLSIAKGSGGLGLLLAKHTYSLAKKGIAKARESGADLAALASVDDVAPAKSSSGRRNKLLAGGAVAAALAAGAAMFRWSRQRSTPQPPAEAPPTLGPSANGSAPSAQQADASAQS